MQKATATDVGGCITLIHSLSICPWIKLKSVTVLCVFIATVFAEYLLRKTTKTVVSNFCQAGYMILH